jgi:parallel beta-helix repeat protein
MYNRSSPKAVKALSMLGSAVILALCCITPALRNIVGKSNTGIFVGNFAVASNGVRVLENRVFDTDVINGHGILVGVGENNVVKDNIITNSDRAGVLVVGTNNTIRDNTINEAAIGLLASTGNNVADNRFFNVAVVQEVFDPGESFASSQLKPDATVRPILRRRLPR